MSLVEAESTGPIEGDDEIVTPPRPPHRRVSVSLLFTLTVLTGTVVAVYLLFPTRDTVMMKEALQRHRDTTPAWDITTPTPRELRAWAIGVLGKNPPLPEGEILGAREVEVLSHRAALLQFELDREPITYLVQWTRVIAPGHAERTDGDLRAIAWRQGPYTCVAVGAEATAKTWVPGVRKRIKR